MARTGSALDAAKEAQREAFKLCYETRCEVNRGNATHADYSAAVALYHETVAHKQFLERTH